MKIGINASFARKPDTGMGQYTLHLIRAILTLPQARDHEFILYFEDRAGADQIPLDAASFAPASKKILPTPLYKRDDLVRKTAWEKVILPKEAKKDELDVFFSPYNSASTFPVIPHVITLHDLVWKVHEKEYINNFRKHIYAKQTFEAIKRARHLITVSEYSKKEIIKYLHINAQFISVIDNGIADYFRPIASPDDARQTREVLRRLNIETPYLLYLGGFEKRKNLPLLLGAFKKMRSSYPNVLGKRKLVIAGRLWKHKNPLATDVKQIVAELNLVDQVIFPGFIEDRDRVSLYRGADLFIFPSFYEGFGMPVLEAMACGCPVLASNRTSLPEVGRDAIEYFNPDREDELVQQLNRLLSEPAALESLAQRGPVQARNFSWDKAARETLTLLTGQ